ncbi:MAG TPA: hypothetical protein VHE36_07825 [Sphingomicrobium sp.]|nr:hypothetical protein [Sphingomicrobium sp.]
MWGSAKGPHFLVQLLDRRLQLRQDLIDPGIAWDRQLLQARDLQLEGDEQLCGRTIDFPSDVVAFIGSGPRLIR